MLNRFNDLLNSSTAAFKNGPAATDSLCDRREELKAEAEVAHCVAEYLESTGFANLEEAIAEGAGIPLRRRRRYRARGRRYLDSGESAAARRAFTGAMLYVQGAVPSLIAAADACGSNVDYVRAMVVLFQSEDHQLLHHALRGNIALLVAAKRVKKIANFVAAYRAVAAKDLAALLRNKTTESEQAEVGRCLGPEWTWDRLIMPAMGRSKAEQPQQGI